jgi:hypothetical protein
MPDPIHGIVSDESVRTIDEVRPLPICKEHDAVRVCIVSGGGGPLPFGTWKGSGTLAAGAAAAASFGYVADVPNAIATDPIQYVRNVSTANTKLGIFVDSNSFAATQITFTAYKNGAPTLLTINVPPGGVGIFQASGAFPYLDTDTWDLRVDNPGGELGTTISFGYGVDYF